MLNLFLILRIDWMTCSVQIFSNFDFVKNEVDRQINYKKYNIPYTHFKHN